MTTAGAGSATRSRHRFRLPSSERNHVVAWLAGIAAFSALGLIGDLLSPVLAGRHPTLLVLLSPRGAYVAAAATASPLAIVLPVAVARLCAADPLQFRLGGTLGRAPPAANRWAALGSRVGGRLPRPAWMVAIAFSPTAKVLFAAGAAGLSGPAVACADVAGTVGRVLVLWSAARAFPGLAGTLRVAVPVVVAGTALVTLVVATAWRGRRLATLRSARVRRWFTQPPPPRRR